MAHVRRQVIQAGIYITVLFRKPFEGMDRKGYAQVMEPWPEPCPIMANACKGKEPPVVGINTAACHPAVIGWQTSVKKVDA